MTPTKMLTISMSILAACTNMNAQPTSQKKLTTDKVSTKGIADQSNVLQIAKKVCGDFSTKVQLIAKKLDKDTKENREKLLEEAISYSQELINDYKEAFKDLEASKQKALIDLVNQIHNIKQQETSDLQDKLDALLLINQKVLDTITHQVVDLDNKLNK